MYKIDRSVAVIKPKQPFVDWANQLPDPEIIVNLKDLQKECTVFLIPDYDFEEEAIECIEELCEDIFVEMLFSWHTEESHWPDNRSSDMFWKWFEVEFHSMVIDPYEDPIEKEEL